MAGRKNQKKDDNKAELIEEALSEFRYEIESIHDLYDEEAIQEIIQTIISEYIGKNKTLATEVEELLKEEWELFLDEADNEDNFMDYDESDSYDDYDKY